MKVRNSTLCYIEKNHKYLMLHRVVKKNDVNKDKWIGVGGHFEYGESPEECVLREVKEETGYDVLVESIVPFGEIEEKRLSVNEPKIWHQISRLYFCDVYPEKGQCNYTENEKKYGFKQILYTLDEALQKHKAMLDKEGKTAWNQREYKMLLLIREYLRNRPN